MTAPEKIAIEICRRSGWTIAPWVYDIIASELRTAIADEREACALAAEGCTCAGINDIWPAAQRAIAEDIRARSKED